MGGGNLEMSEKFLIQRKKNGGGYGETNKGTQNHTWIHNINFGKLKGGNLVGRFSNLGGVVLRFGGVLVSEGYRDLGCNLRRRQKRLGRVTGGRTIQGGTRCIQN